jgi:type IV pilus assembly protein PilB
MRVMDASSLLAAQADLQALLKAGLADDGAVVRLLDRLLHWAHALRASDLHFEPYEGIYRIRIRVDGQLQEWLRPPLAVRERVASRIKVLARLDIAEKRLPQDGRLRHQLAAGQWADFRVSTLPTVHGEKLVVRLIDAAPAQLDLDALGYEPEQKAAVVQALARSHGMILVTGPTGAGKTLSMYS